MHNFNTEFEQQLTNCTLTNFYKCDSSRANSAKKYLLYLQFHQKAVHVLKELQGANDIFFWNCCSFAEKMANF